MTSKVKQLIDAGNTQALEQWLMNTKEAFKEQTTLIELYSAEDDLARTLMPADLEKAGFYPVKTTGNGDCLYKAASIGIAGKTVYIREYPNYIYGTNSCLTYFK